MVSLLARNYRAFIRKQHAYVLQSVLFAQFNINLREFGESFPLMSELL